MTEDASDHALNALNWFSTRNKQLPDLSRAPATAPSGLISSWIMFALGAPRQQKKADDVVELLRNQVPYEDVPQRTPSPLVEPPIRLEIRVLENQHAQAVLLVAPRNRH